ncbi:hypothetical protein AB9P05_17340 [Roseivirga sp. BDSF3-8]|uniref:hypothetical protein n=1 Tax=Roseivirga sp. BDSF3-8 TaxID=3241598 RepID=UPI003531C4BD
MINTTATTHTAYLIDNLFESKDMAHFSPETRPVSTPERFPLHEMNTVRICNQTDYALVPAGAFFQSGKFWKSPQEAGPSHEVVFTTCVLQDAYLNGAGGVALFALQLPDENGGNRQQPVGIGFSEAADKRRRQASGRFTNCPYTINKYISRKDTCDESPVFTISQGDSKSCMIRFRITCEPKASEVVITLTQEVTR